MNPRRVELCDALRLRQHLDAAEASRIEQFGHGAPACQALLEIDLALRRRECFGDAQVASGTRLEM